MAKFFKIFSLLLLILFGLLLVLPSQKTEAHGYIVRSTPADRAVLVRAPNKAQVWFSEGLEREFSTIAVFNQSGQQVDLGDGGVDPRNSAKLVVSLPPDLPNGAYLLRMRPVFVSDGHAVNDTLVFWIGQQVGSVDAETGGGGAIWAEALWRVLLTLALVLLFGAFGMYALVLRPAWFNPTYPLGGLPPRIMRRLSILIWSALGLALLANFAALLQMSAELFQADLGRVLSDQLWNITLEGTNFGDVWGIRLGLLLAMLSIQIIATQQARNRPQTTHYLWLLNGLLAALTLGTLSLISHAAGTPLWRWGSLLIDYLHLGAVGLWVGGLAVLGLILRPALAPLDDAARSRALRAVLKHFSKLAVISLALIVTTGIYSSSVQLDRPAALSNSSYGLTLVAKWLLILPLLGLGAAHHFLIYPERSARIRAWLEKYPRLIQLPGSIRLEMFCALAVLIVGAWLPATPPPAPSNARGEVAERQQSLIVEGYEVNLSISPGAIGANAYDVNINLDGQPAELERVRLRFSYPPLGRYTAPLMLEEVEAGLWVGADGEIERAATWDALIDFKPYNAPAIRAALRWEMMAEVQDDNARQPTPINFLAALSIISILGWAFLPKGYQKIRGLNWSLESVTITCVALSLTLGVTVGGGLLVAQNSRNIEARRNPPPAEINTIFPDQDIMILGRALYETHCLSCHGEAGAGQRPLAVSLGRNTPSLNQSLGNRSDADLKRILEQGLGNRHLIFAENTLEFDEYFGLVIYLRSLE